MFNENLDDTMDGIILLLDAIKMKQAKDDYEEIFNKLAIGGYDLLNMDKFKATDRIKIDKFLTKIISDLNPDMQPHLNINKIKFVFYNNRYVKKKIGKLIQIKNGVSNEEMVNHILDKYKSYLVSGIVPKIDSKDQVCLLTFGTYQQWCAFCEELYSAYYGDAGQHNAMYNELKEA